MAMTYDFGGWATRNNVKCADGKTIMRDAFKHNDGQTVPLVWNHQHDDVVNVLGHALLKNMPEGVYAYCYLNDTENGRYAKELIKHGDVTSMSIYANHLKQQGGNVVHGSIREVSLVLAGANPEAHIDSVMIHGEMSEDEAVIFVDEDISLYHADDYEEEEKEMANKTIGDVLDTLTEEQSDVVYGLLGMALENGDYEEDDYEEDDYEEDDEGEEYEMKQNIFDRDEVQRGNALSHSDEIGILNLAKQSGVGTLQHAISIYAEENDVLVHGIDEIETLFPDYKDVRPGAPELLERDQSWVGHVIRGTHKSPISRIRTRQADARIEELRAHGYKNKGSKKELSGNIKLLSRTTDPQTVYRKDKMERDDIIDITDFDVVNYQWGIMRRNLEEEIARAILIGDGREAGDEMKIYQEHIRSIWLDDELYTIHADVDVEKARQELQGTNTGAHFGENYIYAEAIITAALYSREKYKGSGSLEFYCTPHLLNVMLLARDLNGRRIYDSKTDLAAALNVTAIHTVEQFEDQVRTDAELGKHKLLGIFVNLNDYQVGCTKGGEITKFDQFDIDFNQYKYLIETRLSGALTRPYSAIVLEEPVTEAAGNGE